MIIGGFQGRRRQQYRVNQVQCNTGLTGKETGMSITNLSSIGMNPYDYACSRKKAAGTKNFAQKALGASEKKNAAQKNGSSSWAGDMVVSQPPNYSGFTYDNSVSKKSKEEMTMDEYKQWFMNEMSQMPVSGDRKSVV